MPSGEQAQRQTYREQGDDGERRGGGDRALPGHAQEEGNEWQGRPGGERQERGGGRSQRGAQIVRVQAELLPREDIERLLRPGQQCLADLPCLRQGDAARLVDERQL